MRGAWAVAAAALLMGAAVADGAGLVACPATPTCSDADVDKVLTNAQWNFCLSKNQLKAAPNVAAKVAVAAENIGTCGRRVEALAKTDCMCRADVQNALMNVLVSWIEEELKDHTYASGLAKEELFQLAVEPMLIHVAAKHGMAYNTQFASSGEVSYVRTQFKLDMPADLALTKKSKANIAVASSPGGGSAENSDVGPGLGVGLGFGILAITIVGLIMYTKQYLKLPYFKNRNKKETNGVTYFNKKEAVAEVV